MSEYTRLTALLIALLLGSSPALAEGSRDPEKKPPPDPDPGAYRALASRATPGTPKIDGRLDDPEWELAQEFSDFVQRDPDEGDPATERTVFRVLYDDGSIYVGIRAYDREPGKIVGRLTRRDQYSESDWLIVSIDSYNDRRTAFDFRVNPAGVERDVYRFDDTNSDDSWDAVWDVATSVDEEGWVAEFRIPYSQLRFSEAPEQVWGFNITRIIQRKNETVQWKPIPRESSGWVSEYGELGGIEGIHPPRRLEVLPYVSGFGAMTEPVPGDPFQTGSELMGRVGGDLRYGVTPNMTLDLTVNPDFGEVEADPSVVNLGVFEVFFEERRPFFIEGANIFNFPLGPSSGGSEKLFHSRRIGRAPRGAADARGGFVDQPDKTQILGAAKLSGKSASGWSIGVLDAVTGNARATVIDSEGFRHRDIVEPATNYAVVRLQRDYRGGMSALGGMFTAVNRDVPLSMSFLRSSAYSAGVDWRSRFWNGNFELKAKLLGSRIAGSTEAIESAQTASARFFQRPDARHLTFDPTRTSLVGSAGGLAFSKIGGEHWRGNVNVGWVSPGFEVNDLGFQREADVIRNNLWVGYRELQPGKVFRSYNLNYNAWNRYTFGGERTNTGMNVNGNFRLLSYWRGWAGVERWIGALNTRVLRGGPAMKGPGGFSGWYGFGSDNRKAVSFSAGGWMFKDDERSSGGGIWTDVNLKLVDNLRLLLGPSYSWNYDDWQYVTTADALNSNQYVTGAIDQKTLSLTTRLDWTFRPNLGIQLYAEPFVSAGDYATFSDVTAPRAAEYDDRFEVYGPDRLSFEAPAEPGDAGTYHVDQNGDGTNDFSFGDPNFNFKQFNLNVVLRWEYMSGSTFFLVWSQNKTRFDPTGEFNPGRDFGDLFNATGVNVFRFKINYYLNP